MLIVSKLHVSCGFIVSLPFYNKANQQKGLKLMKLKRILLVILIIGVAASLLGFVLLPKTPPAPQQVASIGELELYLESLADNNTPPALSVMVVKDGALVYQNGFGTANPYTNLPADENSVYHWWSTTKIATVVAILQLEEQAKLALDDTVITYLPWFEVDYPSENSTPITIRHLLNHSSGMPDAGVELFRWIHPLGAPSVNQTEMVQRVLPDFTKLKYEPGQKSTYTNVGYMVLGAVIEAVSGISYEDFVRQNILLPLHMNQTGFVYTDAMLPYAAAGSHPAFDIQALLFPIIVQDADVFIRERKDGKLWFELLYNDQTPPTGLIGPARDMARFEMMLLNAGQLDGVQILKAESVQRMFSESFIPIASTMEKKVQAAEQRGLGWAVNGSGSEIAFSHPGGGPGFGTYMRLYPQQNLGIILMANDTTPIWPQLADLIAQIEW